MNYICVLFYIGENDKASLSFLQTVRFAMEIVFVRGIVQISFENITSCFGSFELCGFLEKLRWNCAGVTVGLL